jgi:hypothetical protein
MKQDSGKRTLDVVLGYCLNWGYVTDERYVVAILESALQESRTSSSIIRTRIILMA